VPLIKPITAINKGDKMAEYNDGSGKWHSETIERLLDVNSDTLCYMILDCKRAIEAMPDNPKCGEYADTIHYAGMALRQRGERYVPPVES
jgi:hypothetical protein